MKHLWRTRSLLRTIVNRQRPGHIERRRARGLTAVSIVVLGLAVVAAAQEPAEEVPSGEPIDDLRTRIPAGDADIKVLDDWINAQLESLKPGPESVAAVDAFRNRFKEQIAKPGNTPEFMALFAERTALAFKAELARCDSLAPPAARVLAWVLTDFNHVAVFEGLAEGLRCAARPDVRFICARGFAGLRARIAVDRVLTGKVIALLREIGVQETDGVVVAAIYEALAFADPDHVAAATDAILDVLAARVNRRRQAGLPVNDGGELQLIAQFSKNRPPTQPQTVRLVGLLAATLRLDVERFGQDGVDWNEKRILAQSIGSIEEWLVATTAPSGTPPNIRAGMAKSGDVQLLEMKIELTRWIGTEETPGVLNEAPWNVPVGAA